MNTMIKKGNYLLDCAIRHYKTIGIIAAGSAFVALATAGVIQYNNYQLEKAYERVVAIQKYIETEVGRKTKISDFEAIQFNTPEEKWNTIAHESSEAAKKSGNIQLQAIFSAYQGLAAQELGNKQEAITHFEAAAQKSSNPALGAEYQLSALLLELDSNEEMVRNKALAGIKQLAEKKGLPVQALALYYLGEYAWTKAEYQDAQNYWSQLVIGSQSNPDFANLELIKKAKTKLKLMKA